MKLGFVVALGVLLETIMGSHLALPLLCNGQLIPRHPSLGMGGAHNFHLALFTHLLLFLSPFASKPLLVQKQFGIIKAVKLFQGNFLTRWCV